MHGFLILQTLDGQTLRKAKRLRFPAAIESHLVLPFASKTARCTMKPRFSLNAALFDSSATV
jgi:hypothetical protein